MEITVICARCATVLADFTIEAVHPDGFILDLLHSPKVKSSPRYSGFARPYKNPPLAASDLLTNMKHHGLTARADALGPFSDSL